MDVVDQVRTQDRLRGRWWQWIVAATGLLLVLLVGVWGRLARPAVPLNDFGSAPGWTLTDHLNRSVRSEAFRGKVIVANFVYTTCTDICPARSGQMLALQNRLQHENIPGDKVQLVSFTVDPARDTPEVLRRYAERFSADPAVWRFVTGPETVVKPLIVEGFKLGVQALPPSAHGATEHAAGETSYAVMHSGRFVLIDQRGEIRAYYPGDEFDLQQVVKHIHALLK